MKENCQYCESLSKDIWLRIEKEKRPKVKKSSFFCRKCGSPTCKIHASGGIHGEHGDLCMFCGSENIVNRKRNQEKK